MDWKQLSGLLSAECLAHAGETLLSGSDDTLMGVWDVEQRKLRCSVRTGHTANIFCTKHMPATGERPSVMHAVVTGLSAACHVHQSLGYQSRSC